MNLHDIVAVAVALVACVFDLHSRRIPNVLTFGAAGAAFIFCAFTVGATAVGWSVAGWVVAAAMWLPLYALGGMGAGDVKLMAAIGAWLAPTDVVHAALYAGITGAVLALMLVVVKGRVRQTWSNLTQLLLYWRVAGLTPHAQFTLGTATGPRLAYAVPIFMGTVLAIWLR